MDVDLLDSSATSEEDQMEMMMMTMMMHQMDKLPEFAGPGIGTGLTYPDLPSSSSSSINFSSGNDSGCTAPVVPLIFDNTSVSSPALSSPSSFPFMTSMAPEDEALIPVGGFLSNIAFTGKFRNAGEIISSGASAFCSSPSSSTSSSSSSYPFQQKKNSSMAAMREMIFRIAAMQPIHIDPESVKPPKRRNVKISKDPQSVAARHRRERISERIRILQRLVPGGTKMDTASMLDEAIHYVKFLKGQVQSLERAAATTAVASTRPSSIGTVGYPVEMANAAGNYTSRQLGKAISSYQRGGAAQVVFSPTEMLS